MIGTSKYCERIEDAAVPLIKSSNETVTAVTLMTAGAWGKVRSARKRRSSGPKLSFLNKWTSSDECLDQPRNEGIPYSSLLMSSSIMYMSRSIGSSELKQAAKKSPDRDGTGQNLNDQGQHVNKQTQRVRGSNVLLAPGIAASCIVAWGNRPSKSSKKRVCQRESPATRP